MNNYICKAKTISDGQLVYGYYVQAQWDTSDEIAHLIIESGTEYRGAGEFFWKGVRRVDPETVCLINKGECK